MYPIYLYFFNQRPCKKIITAGLFEEIDVRKNKTKYSAVYFLPIWLLGHIKALDSSALGHIELAIFPIRLPISIYLGVLGGSKRSII